VPELPEVETVRRGLAPALEGARLARVETRRADLRFPFPERFCARLTGARVLSLDRRAKYLLARLDSGETLAMHLGMSGRFTLSAGVSRDAGGDDAGGRAQAVRGGADVAPGAFYFAGPPNPAHTHVVFETDAGARVEYNDPRRFGFMKLVATDRLAAHPLFRDIGPEPLGPGFDGAHLRRAFSGRKQGVKAALLDQRVVAGLGNIYVCEALHRSGVAPRRAAGRIAAARLDALAVNVRLVLAEAIEAGGSSLRDYAHTDGSMGYFQHRFAVYDRAGARCPTPDCPGSIVRFVQAGRSTFACPVCQR
jgi:formamidopyrimidine-DNA glycosylase